jgi:integrase
VIRLRHIERNRSRHGRVRLFYRRRDLTGHWRRVRIIEPEGSPAFLARYLEIDRTFEDLVAAAAAPRRDRVGPGTLGHLARLWMASAMFRDYDAATQAARRYKIEAMLAEPVIPDQVTPTFAVFPLDRLTPDSVAVLRDRKRDEYGAAKERVVVLKRMFQWARAQTPPLAPHDPTVGLRRIAPPAGHGHHTWTEEEVAQFEAHWPIGTQQRLALDLILYTGVRRSDVVRLGRQHERGGGTVLEFTAHKGRRRAPMRITVPILAPLRVSLDAAASVDLAYLATRHGRPRSEKAFGGWFKRACVAAGLPHCSAHGLRKAGSTRAAEAGATAHQLMSIFGWRTLAQAELYTRAAERRHMAATAMPLLLRPQSATPADAVPVGVAGGAKR